MYKLGFMANPAELLLDMFYKWRNAQITAEQSRNDQDFKNHRAAMKYLIEIEELLPVLNENGTRTAVFERFVPQWSAIILSYPRGWRDVHSGAIDQVPLDQLEALVGYLDLVVIPTDPSKFALLDLYLDAVLIALDDDETLPAQAKNQVRAIIKNIRHCMLNFSVVGDYEFSKAIDQLFASLSSIVMKSQKKERWSNWEDRFVWPFAYDVVKIGIGYGLAIIGGGGLPAITA